MCCNQLYYTYVQIDVAMPRSALPRRQLTSHQVFLTSLLICASMPLPLKESFCRLNLQQFSMQQIFKISSLIQATMPSLPAFGAQMFSWLSATQSSISWCTRPAVGLLAGVSNKKKMFGNSVETRQHFCSFNTKKGNT